ncbi:MAG: hypothetical protein RLZZ299_1442 [Pseudomonadota bacterium]|jgi:hypothetical protein
MSDDLIGAIDQFEQILPARTARGARRRDGLLPAERFLRGARLALTAEQLAGSTWSRMDEAEETGTIRAALWRQALLISAVEQMHRAVGGKPFPVEVPARWVEVNKDGVFIPRHAGEKPKHVPAALGDLGVDGARHAPIRYYLSGMTPQTLWDTLRLGAGVRHAVAHGSLSPTHARSWKLEAALPALFAANVLWVVRLLAWGRKHYGAEAADRDALA